MKRRIYPAVILLVFLLASCAGNGAPTAIPTVVLVPQHESDSAGTAVVASGTVVPLTWANLGFPLTGIVAEVAVELGEEVEAGDILVTLDDEVLAARVAQAEAGVAAAQAQLNYRIRQGEDEVHLESARAEVDRAQAALDGARGVLLQATLKAPFDGTVAALEISPGETVVPGQVVVVLGDLTSFQVETTDLGERDVTSVNVGDAAHVFVEALDSEIDGGVIDVARIAESLGGDVVYRITIGLDEQPAGLRWGMSVEVRILEGS